jgi:RHS repeat-associated protein
MTKRMLYLITLLFATLLNSLALAGEEVTYYHLDGLGSPVAATDANGKLVWSQDYQPHGRRAATADTTNRLWYTGKPEDATGLLYLGARYYNPILGRFMGVDAVRFHETNLHSFNRYAYANNNPYRFIDPDGNLGSVFYANMRGVSFEDAQRVGGMGNAGALVGSGVLIGGGTAAAVATTAIVASGATATAATAARVTTTAVSAYKITKAVRRLLPSEKQTETVTKGAASLRQIKTALTSAQQAYKGSTVAGHSLSKHAGRHPEIWGKMTGSMKTWNDQAMKHFRDIAKGPGKFQKETENGVSFMEKRLNDGRGMRLNMDSTFKGFID